MNRPIVMLVATLVLLSSNAARALDPPLQGADIASAGAGADLPGDVQRARSLLGAGIVGANGQNLGAVEDLLLASDGRLVALTRGSAGPQGRSAIVSWNNVQPIDGALRLRAGASPEVPDEVARDRVWSARQLLAYGPQVEGGRVTDLAFMPDGRLQAALVETDEAIPFGGYYGFSYGGEIVGWPPAVAAENGPKALRALPPNMSDGPIQPIPPGSMTAADGPGSVAASP